VCSRALFVGLFILSVTTLFVRICDSHDDFSSNFTVSICCGLVVRIVVQLVVRLAVSCGLAASLPQT